VAETLTGRWIYDVVGSTAVRRDRKARIEKISLWWCQGALTTATHSKDRKAHPEPMGETADVDEEMEGCNCEVRCTTQRMQGYAVATVVHLLGA
jgi:hypothetical protein